MRAGRFFRNPDFQLRAVGAFVPDAPVNRKVPASLSRQPEIVAGAATSRTGSIAGNIDAASGCGAGGASVCSAGGAAVFAGGVLVASTGGGAVRSDFFS